MKTIDKEKLKIGLQELERQRHEREHQDKNSQIGRVLTVTDGAISDADQRKAVKDLIHDAFWGRSLPSLKLNQSLETQLFAYLTDEKLWDEETTQNVSQTRSYNHFEDKLK